MPTKLGSTAHGYYHRDRPEWMLRPDVPCKQSPELFFPHNHEVHVQRKAQAICSVCPYRVRCAEYAVENMEHYGIWGGTTERQRVRLRRRVQLVNA